MEKTSYLPKYAQLYEKLIQRIRNEYDIGDKFLTEQEIIKQYTLSYSTVSRTMREMMADGLLSRERGSGTFIRSKTKNVQGQGKVNKSIVLCQPIGSFFNNPVAFDPLNWFVNYEIQRGIFDSFNYSIQLVSLEDFIKFTEDESEDRTMAIIMIPSHTILNEITKLNITIPHIVINQMNFQITEFPNVRISHINGVTAGMSYLMGSLGHRKVGLITRGLSHHQDRITGYKLGHEVEGVPLRDEYIVNVDDGSEQSGFEGMNRLLALSESPTAVFADSDIKAYGAIRAIKAAGLRVPEDISVMGFDDIPGNDDVKPALTTVRAPYYELGVKAVELLNEFGESQVSIINNSVLEAELVKRSSCAVSAK